MAPSKEKNVQNKIKDQSGTDKYNHAEVSVMVVQLKLKRIMKKMSEKSIMHMQVIEVKYNS